MEKKLKVGIIGAGSISVFHLMGYRDNPEAELYALCDIDEARLEKMGQEWGVTRLFTDVEEMVKLEELDAVSVCTWNAAHARCAIAALNAGKHVLCEKPMAMNAREAREMQEAARRNGKLLMIGFVRRFGNDCTIVKDFADAEFFGDMYYTKATYLRRNGNPGRWFGDKAYSGGGALIDLGVHVIDLVRYLMGNPKPVSAYGVTFRKLQDRPQVKQRPGVLNPAKQTRDAFQCDVEDLASALVRFDNGAVLSIEASFSLNIQQDTSVIEIFGTKAGARMDPALSLYAEENGYMTNVELNMPTALDFDGLFAREIDHFVACALHGQACIAPAEDGVILMQILDAIYASAESGKEVEITA